MNGLVVAADLLTAFAALPVPDQSAVRATLGRVRAGLPPDEEAAGPFLLLPAGGVAVVAQRYGGPCDLVCVWVGAADEARAWATRHRVEVHPDTGAVQIVAQRDPDPLAEDLVPADRLFGGRSVAALRRLGVPEPLLAGVVAARTPRDLAELVPHLPVEAATALQQLAAGIEPDEVPSAPAPLDLAAALATDASRARFAEVPDDRVLAEMLHAPLAQWRVFLHPSQRRLVEARTSGPTRVLGGAGTGKSVVLMHRARHLAGTVLPALDRAEGSGAPSRVLVTTFTTTLAGDLANQLRRICSPEELDRIEVANLHRWAVRFLRAHGHPCAIAPDAQRRALMEEAVRREDQLHLPPRFYLEEWDQVVQAQDVADLQGWLLARRVGRGVRLSRTDRMKVWPVFEAYRASLVRAGRVERADVVREARLLLERRPQERPCRALLADEVQDFDANDLRLLRAMVGPGPDDLFLVGDAHQRIYGVPASLGRSGIDVRGRGRHLRVNYRTTEEIRAAAVRLLEGAEVDDLDGGVDDLRGYFSLRHGPAPEPVTCASVGAEMAALVERLRGWLGRYRPEELCVATRTRQLAETEVAPALRRAGIPLALLGEGDDEAVQSGVRVATFHRMKGLEFACVALAGVQEGTVPFVLRDAHLSDEASREVWELQERCLVYVAMTRARDEVAITGAGEGCGWWRG